MGVKTDIIFLYNHFQSFSKVPGGIEKFSSFPTARAWEVYFPNLIQCNTAKVGKTIYSQLRLDSEKLKVFSLSGNFSRKNKQYFVAIIVQICSEKFFYKYEFLVFQVLESRNSVEKRLCKFKAEGREFVTFSRHCSCSRELGK